MRIECIYINTHRYDYQLTRTCIASVRYWYPDIEIFLIKDLSNGRFNTNLFEQKWGVKILPTGSSKFGWGYGKLEALFQPVKKSFLVLDADTVLTGPVLLNVENMDADFLVDEEKQTEDKFCTLYYDIHNIGKVDAQFKYPGYSFNTGQWYGTAGILKREDFDHIIKWAEPPESKYPSIIFQGEQGHLNFILHQMEQNGEINIVRKKIMIWPADRNAEFIILERIRRKDPIFPYIIHWAGMKFKRLSNYPRADILEFYQSLFRSKLSFSEKIRDLIYLKLLPMEKRIKIKFIKIKRKDKDLAKI